MESWNRRYIRCRWVVWYLRHGLPADHTAILLDTDVPTVEGLWQEHRQSGRSDPPRPPQTLSHWDLTARTIRGENGTKVRCLTKLGYTPSQIGYILAFPVPTVREFLDRDSPLPDGRPRKKPRTRSEQRRVEATQRRRRQRERRRADLLARRATITPWGSTRATELAEWTAARARPEAPAPPAVDQAVEELATAEQPAIAAAPPVTWNGPTSPHSLPRDFHGRTKVTEAQVEEMRKDRAAGESVRAIAHRWGITTGAVYRALRAPCPAPSYCHCARRAHRTP